MTKKLPVHLYVFFILVSISATAQEIETFRVEDFDLNGKVKSSLVITDYGKEEYHFDESGRLTKSVTKFSESDYVTTYYKYENQELIEKRVENYHDNTFDSATSIANFYSYDSVPERKVTEKIVTYEKELIEKNIYRYGDDGKLWSIESVDTDGIDQSTFSYETDDSLELVTETKNGVLAKTVQTTFSGSESDSLRKKTIITQEYIDGEFNSKEIEIVDVDKKPLFYSSSIYDTATDKWIVQLENTYVYDASGVLSELKIKKQGLASTKGYIYQFDSSEANNWVKEIITPDNTYKTRKIKYYPKLVVTEIEE
ncbi:hypothetical protein [Pseudozobellia sp. WGM2]|uniref:hypothetical protein n=1 Tax=Pseudozobellia sp. WGM2 TaxID=2787625 RepID=UPI001ADF3321|nr:hypothetical protein [Pseudozobellia sp. WGM2]